MSPPAGMYSKTHQLTQIQSTINPSAGLIRKYWFFSSTWFPNLVALIGKLHEKVGPSYMRLFWRFLFYPAPLFKNCTSKLKKWCLILDIPLRAMSATRTPPPPQIKDKDVDFGLQLPQHCFWFHLQLFPTCSKFIFLKLETQANKYNLLCAACFCVVLFTSDIKQYLVGNYLSNSYLREYSNNPQEINSNEQFHHWTFQKVLQFKIRRDWKMGCLTGTSPPWEDGCFICTVPLSN